MKFDQEFPGGIKTGDCFRRLLYTGNKMDGNPIFFYFTQLAAFCYAKKSCTAESIARSNHGLIAIFYFDLSVNAGTTRAG